MKTRSYFTLVVLCILGFHEVAAQGTAFTYQGRLHTNGVPYTGSAEFRSTLWDAVSGGNAVATNNSGIISAPVTGGLFTVTLDFGISVFDGQPRHLQMEVRTAAGSFTLLSPRQPLTPTPYAIHATKAGGIQSGANPTFTGTASFSPNSGPPFTVNSTTKIPSLNADLLDGLDSTAFVAKAGDTMAGNLTVADPSTLSFGSNVRQMINLWGSVYGIGVQTASLYFRSDDGFAWFRDGIHATGTFDPGTGGTALMTLDAGGQLRVNSSGATALTGISAATAGNGIIGEANNGASAYGVWGRSADGYGGVFTSANGYAGQFNGAVRVNYASPFNKPQLELDDPSDAGFARLRMKTGTRSAWDIAVGTTPGNNNTLRFFNEGSGDVMMLHTNGTLFCNVLTIRGGADLAEPFEMPAEIPKGAVVVIDDEHPGRLKLSERAYDTRVAGIVSGAKGVKPGLTLSQQGELDSGQHVALTGRVYAQADATHAPIKPGDLLTTSEAPGHAMKVTDPSRAQGAILGKAMSALNEGKGHVLVLVTLQ